MRDQVPKKKHCKGVESKHLMSGDRKVVGLLFKMQEHHHSLKNEICQPQQSLNMPSHATTRYIDLSKVSVSEAHSDILHIRVTWHM